MSMRRASYSRSMIVAFATPPASLVAKAQAGETDGTDQPLVAAG